jgi:hypothetical protein
MLNFVENLLENERGPMNDQDLTKTDYDPDRGSLSFSNKFSTKFSIVSNKLNKSVYKRTRKSPWNKNIFDFCRSLAYCGTK